jgi:uncharacterized membrane protein
MSDDGFSRHPHWSHGETESSRILPFSDGVFAIAITLLAMQLDVPIRSIPNETAGSLAYRVLQLWPMFESFVISFLVIGVFWVSHHRLFRLIRRYDTVLIWLNIVLLMCISFLPFSTELLGTHGGNQFALVFYSASLVVTGLVQLTIWLYASHRHRLIEADLDRHTIWFFTMRSLTLPFVFTLSVPVSFYSPRVALNLWVLIFPFFYLLSRMYHIRGTKLA